MLAVALLSSRPNFPFLLLNCTEVVPSLVVCVSHVQIVRKLAWISPSSSKSSNHTQNPLLFGSIPLLCLLEEFLGAFLRFCGFGASPSGFQY
jgi:hypothetical protein